MNFPDQLVMGVDHFYGIFLFCHDEILSGSAFSVKVYVFMEDLPVDPRLFPILKSTIIQVVIESSNSSY
jgi:hypothetical protein